MWWYHAAGRQLSPVVLLLRKVAHITCAPDPGRLRVLREEEDTAGARVQVNRVGEALGERKERRRDWLRV